jgi:hypothetical protein
MITLLHSLDVVTNWLFKVNLWWLYNKWIMTTKNDLITSGIKEVCHCQQCEQILAAWHSISAEIMEKSFRVREIFNERDGSEDFMINDTDNKSKL